MPFTVKINVALREQICHKIGSEKVKSYIRIYWKGISFRGSMLSRINARIKSLLSKRVLQNVFETLLFQEVRMFIQYTRIIYR